LNRAEGSERIRIRFSPGGSGSVFGPKHKSDAEVFSLVVLLFAVRLFGQSNLGELRLKVTDPAGLGLPASVTLVSEANQFRQTYITRAAGDLDARGLPFAVYRFRVTQQGFSTYSGTVEIRSAIPLNLRVSLSVATVETSLVVKGS